MEVFGGWCIIVGNGCGLYPVNGCSGYVKMSTKIASRTLPSIFDPDSDEEPEYDESYKKYAEDDTGPSLLPLQVSTRP